MTMIAYLQRHPTSTLRTSGLPTLHSANACAVCGCTQQRACPGGCAWATAELCTACLGRIQAILDPPRRERDRVFARIAGETNANLLVVAYRGASGDWRRRALARRLMALGRGD